MHGKKYSNWKNIFNAAVKAKINTWGKEIYFSSKKQYNVRKDAKEVFKLGEIAF